MRVIPSTAGQSTWVIAPSGCHPGESGTSAFLICQKSRGGLFNASQSNSWLALGNYSLGLDANLGYGDLGAVYGLDTITLGFSDSIGGLTIGSQVVAAQAVDHYYTGLFGLNHQATNLTNFTDPHPSFLATLKKNSMIPSLSWGYTAGAQYRRSFPSALRIGLREPRYKYTLLEIKATSSHELSMLFSIGVRFDVVEKLHCILSAIGVSAIQLTSYLQSQRACSGALLWEVTMLQDLYPIASASISPQTSRVILSLGYKQSLPQQLINPSPCYYRPQYLHPSTPRSLLSIFPSNHVELLRICLGWCGAWRTKYTGSMKPYIRHCCP